MLVVVTGWLVLDETVSGPACWGSLLVVAGSWLLNFEHAQRLNLRTLTAPLQAIVANPARV